MTDSCEDAGMTDTEIQDRLASLRAAIEAENISYGEISELQDLAPHIDPGDVLLLQWAGVPEFETLYGVGWYGDNASIAQTGYEFRLKEDAERFARDGATAANFWLWANQQPFQIDELTDGNDLPIVRADVETGDPTFTATTAWLDPKYREVTA